MGKKVRLVANESADYAVAFFRKCTGWKDAVQKIQSTFRGKISNVNLLKLKKGVSTVVRIKFPDGSAVNINKYLPYDGKMSVSIKRED
jgi:hypothetical protein